MPLTKTSFRSAIWNAKNNSVAMIERSTLARGALASGFGSRLRFVCLIIFGMFQAAIAHAQDLPFGECRTGYWSSSRNLDDAAGLSSSACFLNWKAQLGENVRTGLNVRLLQGHPNQNRSQFNGRLREAYIQSELAGWSFKLGRQIIVWGRSDRVSPTDVLSSRDFTARVADDDEQRNGNDSLSARLHYTPEVSFTAIVSRFEPNRMPSGSLPGNLVDAERPTRSEVAFKLDRSGSGFDASITYFDGFDKTPRYGFGPSNSLGNAPGNTSPTFRATHERLQMTGIDFASAIGRWTVRSEAAHFKASPDCADCNLISRNIRRAVIGADRDFLESANIGLQLFGVKRSGYVESGNSAVQQIPRAEALNRLNSEFGAIERGATLRLSNRWLNEALKVELAGIFDLTNNSQVVRGRINYAVNDRIRLYFGFDQFRGAAQTYFGSRKKNQVGFFDVAIAF